MQYNHYGQIIASRSGQWKEIWPTTILAFIAIGQMLLTFAIVGLETWSMTMSIRYSFLFIGYIASFFFLITWISTFTVVCCNGGSRGCATHALVENIISIIASIVLIYYDSQFLRSPSSCFWSTRVCFNYGVGTVWDILSDYNIFNLRRFKIIAVRSQLACACIMLFLCLCFFGIYIYAVIKVGNKQVTVSPTYNVELRPVQLPPPPPPQQQQRQGVHTISIVGSDYH